MKWANTWWCYYYFKVPAENRTKELLTNNVCKTWVPPNGVPETIGGNQAEMRYMYWLDPTYLAFLGTVRVDGTSTFTWYAGVDYGCAIIVWTG
ncbi:hypothetical protein AAVH_11359 [Aphelenchoides avenae]|nr:hypothetical protein AAVH_35149 [Aphelenchus avenae]KAH7721123.1 hypothetical protein AAVH_11359 [Aphelenchus avenae]